jgi:hypothetical protein
MPSPSLYFRPCFCAAQGGVRGRLSQLRRAAGCRTDQTSAPPAASVSPVQLAAASRGTLRGARRAGRGAFPLQGIIRAQARHDRVAHPAPARIDAAWFNWHVPVQYPRRRRQDGGFAASAYSGYDHGIRYVVMFIVVLAPSPILVEQRRLDATFRRRSPPRRLQWKSSRARRPVVDPKLREALARERLDTIFPGEYRLPHHGCRRPRLRHGKQPAHRRGADHAGSTGLVVVNGSRYW